MRPGNLTINVETYNDAFTDETELARVLSVVADRAVWDNRGTVSDSNGNTVGTWTFRPEPMDVDLTDVDTFADAIDRAGIWAHVSTSDVPVPDVFRSAAAADPDGTAWVVKLHAPERDPLYVDYWTGSRVEESPTDVDVVESILLDVQYLTEEPFSALPGLTRETLSAIDARERWLRDVFGDAYDRLTELANEWEG